MSAARSGLSLVLLLAALAGCSGAPVPVNYAPSSVLSASGGLSVAEFAYFPAEHPLPSQGVTTAPVATGFTGGDPDLNNKRPRQVTPAVPRPVAPNQIRNSAIGEVRIDRDVKAFVRDAVFAELRFVGLKTNDLRRVLRGDIEEFFIDDLGFSVTWTLRIAYEVRDPAADKLLYRAVKSIQRRTAKFSNPFGALNETIKLNAEELIKDPDFLAVVQ